MLRQKQRARPNIKRFIVVGLDGQDPRLTDRFMAEGKLPNFERLAKQGTYLEAADDLSLGFSGRLVLVQYGHPSVQAQHLRLPGSRPANLLATVVVGSYRQRRSSI